MERDDIFEKVTGYIVEVLSVDAEEATRDARFFQDLKGESIDLLDLQFRISRDPGVEVAFDSLTRSVKTDERGLLLADSLIALRAEYPFLPFERLPAEADIESLKGLLTVNTICELVWQCLERKEGANFVSVSAPT